MMLNPILAIMIYPRVHRTERLNSPRIFTRIIRTMSMFDQNLIIGLVVIAVAVLVVYSYAPQLAHRFMPGSGLAENFAVRRNKGKSGAPPVALPKDKKDTPPPRPARPAPKASGAKEVAGFADYQESLSDTMGSVPMKPIKKPQDCFPREQLNAIELLPQDTNSQWAQVNPTGAGDMIGKNMLSAGALIGVNTIGQSLRNANYQLRAEPPPPQVQVSPWQQSTIEPDLQRRALE